MPEPIAVTHDDRDGSSTRNVLAWPLKRLFAHAASPGVAARRQPRSSDAAEVSIAEQSPRGEPRGMVEELAARAERQALALSTLAEIDRAILSRANSYRIMQTVLEDVRAVISCDVLAITLLGNDTQPQARMVMSTARGLCEDRCDLDPATLQFLTSHLDGRWADEGADHPFLIPLASLGAEHILLLPIFVDANLSAVLTLGLTGQRVLTDEQRTYARDFADRFGVVLTAGSRDESLHVEGRYDALTALPNRRSLTQRLAEEISRAQREQSRFAVLFVGLDGFKRVNESIGHAGGDSVLQEAASRMKLNLREQDIIARLSGDQFVALLPAIPDTVGPGKTAAKLIAVLAQPFTAGQQSHDLGASIGICIYPDDGRNADKLLHSAELAMSRAKRGGRGQYVFFEEQVDARISERVTLERDLRLAIGDNQLIVMYQPLIDLRTGKLTAVEALLRWQHPRRGFVQPGDFIGVAEQSTLIERIGEYVRQAVCEQYGRWEASGVAPERISVNVSSREIRRKDFAENIERLLRDTGMRPFSLELEITESMLVEDSAHVLSVLRRLHDRGVRIAIDDFGTGYSCLGYLKQFPFDVLKIDRTFVSGIGTGDGSDAIFSAIVAMAHSLGKEVVAEGVETEQQHLFVANNGCDVGQGYLWSRPTSADDFVQYARALKPTPSPVARRAMT